jgi:CDP-glycerol glycerophosphotransferase (TagB/SpsB family)
MALSIMVDESVNILEQVIDSDLVGENELEFMVKPHPTMNNDILKKRLGGKWSQSFQEVEGSTPDYIRKSDLLITGMSTVGLEAVVLGVPVIVVETLSGLAFDPIPDSVPSELWRTCRSPDEISEAIQYFKNRSPEVVSKHRGLSAQIKKDYFEPVTRESVLKFLNIDEESKTAEA